MKRNLNWLDRVMLAVTFAEAGCPELADGFIASGKGGGKVRTCHGPECTKGGGAKMAPLAARR